ncbi:hypothetical protein EDC01DRAFT_755899 [Geopyxis carbonaria]|nr:hypothetical protein EDC01DRAFT_755899 [Geopyxis carbonaria]
MRKHPPYLFLLLPLPGLAAPLVCPGPRTRTVTALEFDPSLERTVTMTAISTAFGATTTVPELGWSTITATITVSADPAINVAAEERITVTESTWITETETAPAPATTTVTTTAVTTVTTTATKTVTATFTVPNNATFDPSAPQPTLQILSIPELETDPYKASNQALGGGLGGGLGLFALSIAVVVGLYIYRRRADDKWVKKIGLAYPIAKVESDGGARRKKRRGRGRRRDSPSSGSSSEEFLSDGGSARSEAIAWLENEDGDYRGGGFVHPDRRHDDDGALVEEEEAEAEEAVVIEDDEEEEDYGGYRGRSSGRDWFKGIQVEELEPAVTGQQPGTGTQWEEMEENVMPMRHSDPN